MKNWNGNENKQTLDFVTHFGAPSKSKIKIRYLQFCNDSTCNCYSNLKWNTITVLFDLVNVGIQKKLLENMYLLKPKISIADGLNSVPHCITS